VSWIARTAVPAPARQEAAAAGVRRDFYLFGGGGASAFADADVYRPGSGWATLTSLPATRRDFPAAADGLDAIYLPGGRQGGGSVTATFSQMWRYNIAADTYTTTLAAMPATRFDHSSVYDDGKVYVFGGTNASNVNTTTVYVYDVAGDSWSTATSIPAVLAASSAVKLGRYVYLIGGSTTGGSTATVRRYSLDNDTWSTVASLPAARQGMGAAALGAAIVATGGLLSSGAEDDTWVYSVKADTWTTVQNLPDVRVFGSMARAGSVLRMVGGRASGTGSFSQSHYEWHPRVRAGAVYI
jgi:N-acetylneuraminic acid mutarotase